jgi:hypothetical protein
MSQDEKNSNFKAVDFQRERREELSKLMHSDPSEFERKLELIRKNYSDKFRIKKKHIA